MANMRHKPEESPPIWLSFEGQDHSAGIPAVYTKVLAMSALPGWQHYALLVLYVIVFMLDDSAIFVLAMMTLAATGMTSRYLRVSHLAGGVVMLTIGILLMIAPG